MNEIPNIEQSYYVEFVRKAVHFCSLSIPIGYCFVSQQTALSILVPLTLAFLAVDVARHVHEGSARLFYNLFSWLLRAHERDTVNKRLNGATYVLISATLCVLIFPKLIVVVAFAILIISDITAALVGRKWGKTRFLSKSAEGSLAFFVSASLVIFLSPKIEYRLGEYMLGFFAAGVGTIVEAAPLPLDDNLSVPLSIGFSLWALYAVFYPAYDLSRVVFPF